MKRIICAIFGHKFENWFKTGGNSITESFEYEVRNCKRCGEQETKNWKTI